MRYDTYIESYLNDKFERIQEAYRRRNMIELLERYKHDTMLEIGCGVDPIGKFINIGKKYVIVEPLKECIEYAHKELHNHYQNIEFYEGFFEDCVPCLSHYSFDYITASGVLPDVIDPVKFLSSIMKVCNKDTVVHINVPNARSFHRILANESGIIDDIYNLSLNNIMYGHNTVYDMQSLCRVINETSEKYGYCLNIIEKGSYFPKMFSHKQMALLLEKDIITNDVLDGVYNMGKCMPDMGSEIYVNFSVQYIK